MKLDAFQVSAGEAQGHAVLFDSAKPNDFYTGKIVLVKNLDLNDEIFRLGNAAAIISEKGGLTAHGAIIAREFKIPCLVLSNAGQVIKGGDFVKVGNNSVELEKQGKPTVTEPRAFSPIREGDWVCYRPYSYSAFINDFRENAFRDILKILHISREEVPYRNDERGYWLKGFPEDELLEKIKGDSEWLQQIIDERKEFYNEFMGWLDEMARKISKGQPDANFAIENLKKARKFYPKYMAYLYITNILSDKFQEAFYAMLKNNLPQELAFNYINEAFQSNYVKKMLKENIPPAERAKDLVFPSPKIVFFRAKIDYNTKTRFDGEIERALGRKDPKLKSEFIRYAEICPLLERLSEETMICVRALRLVVNNLLEMLGETLAKRGVIGKVDEIVNFNLDQIVKKLGQLEFDDI